MTNGHSCRCRSPAIGRAGLAILGEHQFDVADTKCLREQIQGDNRRVALTPLKTAQILLAETGQHFGLFLRQSFSRRGRKFRPTDLRMFMRDRRQSAAVKFINYNM